MHAARQILEIDLMHDADAGRHDLERIEGLHAPLHEFVALCVALEFDLHVEVQCIPGAVVIDLNRVIDDQVDRHQRLDDLWILADAMSDAAHRGQVAEQWHSGEILEHDARDDERYFLGAWRVRRPVGELPHVLLGHLLAVAVAEHAFENDANGNRQPRDTADPRRFERGQ